MDKMEIDLEIGTGEEALRQLKQRQALFYKNVRLLQSYGKHLSQEDAEADMKIYKASKIQDNILSFDLPPLEEQSHLKDIISGFGYHHHQNENERRISDYPQNLETFDDIHIFNITLDDIKKDEEFFIEQNKAFIKFIEQNEIRNMENDLKNIDLNEEIRDLEVKLKQKKIALELCKEKIKHWKKESQKFMENYKQATSINLITTKDENQL